MPGHLFAPNSADAIPSRNVPAVEEVVVVLFVLKVVSSEPAASVFAVDVVAAGSGAPQCGQVPNVSSTDELQYSHLIIVFPSMTVF